MSTTAITTDTLSLVLYTHTHENNNKKTKQKQQQNNNNKKQQQTTHTHTMEKSQCWNLVHDRDFILTYCEVCYSGVMKANRAIIDKY